MPLWLIYVIAAVLLLLICCCVLLYFLFYRKKSGLWHEFEPKTQQVCTYIVIAANMYLYSNPASMYLYEPLPLGKHSTHAAISQSSTTLGCHRPNAAAAQAAATSVVNPRIQCQGRRRLCCCSFSAFSSPGVFSPHPSFPLSPPSPPPRQRQQQDDDDAGRRGHRML